MPFSEKIRALMDAHSLSQYEMARKLKISTSMVHGWLNGSRPQRRIATKLASYFNVTTDELLNDTVAIQCGTQPMGPTTQAMVKLLPKGKKWGELTEKQRAMAFVATLLDNPAACDFIQRAIPYADEIKPILSTLEKTLPKKKS